MLYQQQNNIKLLTPNQFNLAYILMLPQINTKYNKYLNEIQN